MVIVTVMRLDHTRVQRLGLHEQVFCYSVVLPSYAVGGAILQDDVLATLSRNTYGHNYDNSHHITFLYHTNQDLATVI